MRQPPGHGLTRDSFAAAAPTPPVCLVLDDPAGQYRLIWFESLPHSNQAELVKAAEHGQVRAREDSIMHVEVFQKVS